MRATKIEPGLLSVFRLFVGFRWLLVIFSIFEQFTRQHAWPHAFHTLSVIELGLLTVYLFWPWLQAKLSHWYLPLALVATSVLQIVEVDLLFQQAVVTDSVSQLAFVWEHTQQLMLLLFPLFLIGWQYHFRAVFFYCIGVAALQVALFNPIVLANSNSLMEARFEELFIRTIIFLIVGYLVVRLMDIQRRQRQALALANDRLVVYAATLEQLAVSRERNRIARELHDTLAHTLSGLAVQLDSVTTLWDSIPPKASAMLEQSLATTRSGLDETRRALQALRASPLEDLGLSLAIRTLAEEVASRGNLSLEIECSTAIGDLPPEVEHCFYRVAQEALENVVRHANAHNITIRLKQIDGTALLTISDDGVGFLRETVPNGYQLGIRGMQERAEMIGAKFWLDSQYEQGTTANLVWEQQV